MHGNPEGVHGNPRGVHMYHDSNLNKKLSLILSSVIAIKAAKNYKLRLNLITTISVINHDGYQS